MKFSAGGDKLSVRYDAEPDLEKLKAQVTAVPNVQLRALVGNTVVGEATGLQISGGAIESAPGSSRARSRKVAPMPIEPV